MIVIRLLLVHIIVIALGLNNLYGDEEKYLITKSTKANTRYGPDFKYGIKYTYILPSTLFKIKNVSDEWYFVEDLEGEEGWVYKNIVSSKKKNKVITIRSRKDIFCYSKPRLESKKAFKTSYLVNFRVKSCDGDWCFLEKDGVKGWCQRRYLWGI